MITPHIEKEYKMLISEKDYLFFLDNFEFKSAVQVNHYYDSHDRSVSLRIREVNNTFLFTIKKKINNDRYEYEFELKEHSFDDERVKELFEKFNIVHPEYLGSLTTTRNKQYLQYGEFCLDKNEYCGKTDYEIEFELYDSERDHIEEFALMLNKAGLTFKENPTSKFARFLKESQK